MNEAHGVFSVCVGGAVGVGGSVRVRGWDSCPGHPPGITVPSAQLPGSNAVRRGGAVGLIHSPHTEDAGGSPGLKCSSRALRELETGGVFPADRGRELVLSV